MKSFNGFTNLQPVTKTVKFRLDPVGNTMKNVEKNNILENAALRVEKRNELKVYIDKFHKEYIDKKLSDFSALSEEVFPKYIMDELFDLYTAGDKAGVESRFAQIGEKLTDYMTNSKEYEFMEKKEFIKDILPNAFKGDNEAQLVFSFFEKSVTEVRDLNMLRKELYSGENKHGTILKRTVWDNLGTYLSNAVKLEKFSEMYNDGSILTKHYRENLDKLSEKVYGIGHTFDISEFRHDAYFLHVSQSGIDRYNTMISGYSLEDGTKIPGLNEIIQVHNSKSTNNEQKLPFFTTLYKQMMSDSRTFSFVDEAINSDSELYGLVDSVIEDVDEGISGLRIFIENIRYGETDKIFVSKFSHGDISNALFKKYSVIDDAIAADYNLNHPAKDQETKSFLDKRKKYLNSVSCYSIDELNRMIKGNVCLYFSAEIADLLNEYGICKENYEKFDRTKKPFKQNKSAKITVKALLDSVIEISRFLKRLVPTDMPLTKDEMFYAELQEYINVLAPVTKVYNRARNYATKKEYEKKELGITFNNKDFLSGWTNSNVGCGVILLKDNSYYLAVIDSENKSCMSPSKVVPGKDNYKMVDYNLLTDPSKSLPHSFMSNKFLSENPEIEGRYDELYKKYDAHRTDGYQYTEDDVRLLITYYSECLHLKYDDVFHYQFRDPEDYRDLNDFFNDVTAQSYKLNFIDVGTEYIESLIDKGSIYLFRISGRDFSETHPKNTSTLFGLYWKMLFDPRNVENPIYKLNGGASVTYREKSIEKPFVHKAGEEIRLKKSKSGETKTFQYDIIKNRRYTYDSFFFSVSITANYSASNFIRFNGLANNYIRQNHKDMHVIGITRGIKNLIYYTVIDMDGNVVEHNSLNVIKTARRDGVIVEDDYNENLTNRAKENAGKKEQWDSEYTIKDLKQGYMSQVVSAIAKLMIKYNAVVVLEDLNGKFKDKQKAIEQTIFTDFENALLNKLNFLVTDKNIENDDMGSVLKAYQLCMRVSKKEDMKYQNGFVFFLSPAYTSNLDPSTGFVNMLDTRYKGKENAKVFLNKISFENCGDYYSIGFDYKDFRYIGIKTEKTKWNLNTKGIRYNIFRNKSTNMLWKGETINLTEAFSALFEEYGVDIQGDIIGQIVSIDRSGLYEKFLDLFRLTLMTNNNLDNDYVYASAVEGSLYNEHYGLADNIASYNMARKGLMAIDKILAADDDFVKLAGKADDWINYNIANPHKA